MHNDVKGARSDCLVMFAAVLLKLNSSFFFVLVSSVVT